MAERDHIGPDPVLWIERLMGVNTSAQFGIKQKQVISAALMDLRATLLTDAALTGPGFSQREPSVTNIHKRGRTMKATMREIDVLAEMIDKPMKAEAFARRCNDNRLVRTLLRKGYVQLNAIPATEVSITNLGRSAFLGTAG
jgi:hypothetical protein